MDKKKSDKCNCHCHVSYDFWRTCCDRAEAKSEQQPFVSLSEQPIPEADCERPTYFCNWSQVEFDDNENWETSCGNEFTTLGGTLTTSGFQFCTYCGKPIKEICWQC